MLYHVPDWLAQPQTQPTFLVNPYVPTASITLLYGKWGRGKSPLTWELARSVATGSPFLSCPTQRGTVLYIECDSPERQVHARLAGTPAPDGWHMIFTGAFNVLARETPVPLRLAQANRALHPNLVIINTLRRCHYGDDKESSTPSRVYSAFQSLFPGASLWFNHHDRKVGDKDRPADEAFSGAQAWVNDIQVGLHIRLVKEGDDRVLKLVMPKNQAAPDANAGATPLVIRLTGSSRSGAEVVAPKAQQARDIMEQTGASRATAYRRIAGGETKSPTL